MMAVREPAFQLRFAETDGDIEAAQRLRYTVFAAELGADGASVDHGAARDTDRFDAYAAHLLLVDPAQRWNNGVVGTYRLLSRAGAAQAGGFYSDAEFDLDPILASGRNVLELGRSCVLKEYRRTTAMFDLWAGLAAHVMRQEIEILFGVASFPGTDPAALAEPLSLLHHGHLAAPDLRVKARPDRAARMDLIAADHLDRVAAARALPPLIKAYLRIGGTVGQGAWIDHGFNTTDVCMILDVAQVPEAQRALYTGAQTSGIRAPA